MIEEIPKLSIIICSRIITINNNLFDNIKSTVGCNYELIIIDNSKSKYSIFEAYNLGIKKSIGEYLCFMHDDILIHTQDWGMILSRIFKENSSVGLIGVAGSKVKTRIPSGWWNCPDEFKEISIIQHLKNNEVEKWNYGFNNGVISEVVVIDGVFMAMRKDEYIKFNSELKGFHNYDLNISLEYKIKGYKIIVTDSVLIEHFSIGSINKDWCESTLQLHRIYADYLPLKTNNILNRAQLDLLEFNNGTEFINQLLNFGYIKQMFKLWFKLFVINPLSKFHRVFFERIMFKIKKKMKLI